MLPSDVADPACDLAKSMPDPNASDPGLVPSPVNSGVKRSIDVIGALTFFLVFGPLYVVVALSVWVGTSGSLYYRQTRLGKGGKPFHLYKFRSMVKNADQVLEEHLANDPTACVEWNKYQKLTNDPRITRVGKFIRRFSLDELPQFWNVLRGDMSLIGPRPCMERQRSLYGGAWAFYAAVRPGLTGLWQVSGRNNLTFAQRVALDTQYVTSWSLLLDGKILLRTFRAVLMDGK